MTTQHNAITSPKATSRGLPDDFKNFDKLPDSAFITQRCIELLYAVSGTTVWRRVKSGALPRPTRIGPQQNRWRAGDIRALLNGEVCAND